MSAPVPEQAILGPLIYAPPWARRQKPTPAPAGDADPWHEDRTEPAAAEPLGLPDLGLPDQDASFAEQPSANSANVEDDFDVMTLEECLALAPEQGTDASEPMAELEPPRWGGIGWPVLTRLACTILLALAGATGFRWLSAAPAEPQGQLVVQEWLPQEQAAPAIVTTLKTDREPQPAPPLWSLDLMLSAGTSHDPGRQLTMSAAAAPGPAPAGGATAAAVALRIVRLARRDRRATGLAAAPAPPWFARGVRTTIAEPRAAAFLERIPMRFGRGFFTSPRWGEGNYSPLST
jgi:hypothetical protein